MKINKGDIVIAKTNLVCDKKNLCFCKGDEYTVINEPTTMTEVNVWNHRNEIHRLGNWSKHFKLKKIMTKKELLIALIAIYKKAIEELPKNKWIYYLIDKQIDCGICNCAKKTFGIDIYLSDWPLKYGNFWGNSYPSISFRDDAIKSLQLRIDNMEKELLITKDNEKP